MVSPKDPSVSDVAEALDAIARVSGSDTDTLSALRALTSAATRVLQAEGGLIVSLDRQGAPRVTASVGVPDSVAATLDDGGCEEVLRAMSGGDEVELPVSTLGWPALCMPLAPPGGVTGALVVVGGGAGEAQPDGLRGARIAAARAGGLLEIARLRGDLELAMAQILEADERMMGRIGLDIHDGPTQQLSVALLEVQLIEADLDEVAVAGGQLPAELRPALARIYETLGGALHEMRELIGHLRPAQFEDRALDDILRDATVAVEARGDAQVDMKVSGEFPVNGVSISQRITFYRVLQEALSNAHRHGGASRVEVLLRQLGDGVELVVSDDGSGFDPSTVLPSREPGPKSRVGLRGMRDRAQVLGGRFDVQSAPGSGTTVRLFIPTWTAPDIAKLRA